MWLIKSPSETSYCRAPFRAVVFPDPSNLQSLQKIMGGIKKERKKPPRWSTFAFASPALATAPKGREGLGVFGALKGPCASSRRHPLVQRGQDNWSKKTCKSLPLPTGILIVSRLLLVLFSLRSQVPSLCVFCKNLFLLQLRHSYRLYLATVLIYKD